MIATLAEAVGGSLQASSVQGRGSTFTFALDLPAAAEPAATEALRPAGPSLAGLRVLLAEDVAMNRDLITLLLRGAGVRLATACDGAEAVQAAERERFDVLLMDLQMPEVDGLEAARRLRAGSGPNRDTPIVALTANVLPDEISRCLAAGMTTHPSKPVSAARLKETLAKAAAVPPPVAPAPAIRAPAFNEA